MQTAVPAPCVIIAVSLYVSTCFITLYNALVYSPRAHLVQLRAVRSATCITRVSHIDSCSPYPTHLTVFPRVLRGGGGGGGLGVLLLCCNSFLLAISKSHFRQILTKNFVKHMVINIWKFMGQNSKALSKPKTVGCTEQTIAIKKLAFLVDFFFCPPTSSLN